MDMTGIPDELSEESRKVLKECFEYFDDSGDGVIDSKELPEALRFAGINPCKEDAKELIRLFDSNGDGKLQISELVDNWKALCQHSVNGSELISAFKKLDRKNEGSIKMKDLERVLMNTGEKWSAEEARDFCAHIEKFDKNKDGCIDYPEFVEMWMADAFPFKKPTIPEKKPKSSTT